jgi:hypothetical protein
MNFDLFTVLNEGSMGLLIVGLFIINIIAVVLHLKVNKPY